MEAELVYEFQPYVESLTINPLRDFEERVVVITFCVKWYQSWFNSRYEGLGSVRASSSLYVKGYKKISKLAMKSKNAGWNVSVSCEWMVDYNRYRTYVQ